MEPNPQNRKKNLHDTVAYCTFSKKKYNHRTTFLEIVKSLLPLPVLSNRIFNTRYTCVQEHYPTQYDAPTAPVYPQIAFVWNSLESPAIRAFQDTTLQCSVHFLLDCPLWAYPAIRGPACIEHILQSEALPALSPLLAYPAISVASTLGIHVHTMLSAFIRNSPYPIGLARFKHIL